MACATKFDDSIPFGCIGEIISEVRTGTGNVRSIGKKAAWVAGCTLEGLDGVVDLPEVVVLQSEDAQLELLAQHFGGGDAEAARRDPPERPENIPPEVWAILIQLLLKWIGGGFARR